MYNTYFGFTEKPFTISPNPRYLFMSERHQEALAHMLYSMQGEGGVMVLTGEVGTGKTTICRSMLEQVPEKTHIAYIINPKQSATELLASICDELHIVYEKPETSIKILTDLLNEHLLEQHTLGFHTVLIIDEAQNLEASVLEQLRLLTNLETNEKKLLQIMLLGQPELGDMLQRQDMRQLAQRITAQYHLTPLNKHEMTAYLNHRLSIAGCENTDIFPAAVVKQLYQYTAGVPRLINLIADRALLGAYSNDHKRVNSKILAQAQQEVCGHLRTANMKKNRARLQPRLLYLAVFLLFIVALNAYKTEWFGDTWDASQQVITMKNLAPKQSLSVQVEPLPTHKNTAEMVDEITALPTAQLQNDKNTELKTTALPTKDAQVTSTTMMPTFAQQNDAFQAVFAAWNIDYDPKTDGEACVFAKKHQLQCLRQRQSIAQMRNLNRPAVLTLSDASGATAFVAINALSGTHAYLAPLDGSEANDTAIPLPSLALQSHNDFTILWQTPKAYKGPVRPGHQGKLVQQLAEKCTQVLQQQWIGAPRLLYDATLKEQVKIFQRNQGLSPDGVAGPITWIHLNSLTNQGFPSLTYTPAELQATNQGEG